MPRRFAWALPLVALSILIAATLPVGAVITKPMPLKQVLQETPLIFVAAVAKVENADPEKPPLLVLKVGENLKGKVAFERMPINLAGDDEAKKEKQTAALLKRVAVDMPLLIFASQREDDEERFTAFAYTNGTWFQMRGQVVEKEPLRVNWQFLHCETYFRRTFHGTTEELRKTVVEGLAGKKEPPEYDAKVEPGLGPEVPQDKPKEPKKDGARITGGPTFGVIPMVAIGGPLAILSMLFPTLFGKPKDVLRRWLVLLTVASVISTVYLLHSLLEEWLQDVTFDTRPVLWVFMAVVAAAGWYWAIRRFDAVVRKGQGDTLRPMRGEEIVFRLIGLSGLILGAYALGLGKLLESPWLELLLMWGAVWAAVFCLAYVDFVAARLPMLKPVVPLERIMLLAMTVTCAAVSFSFGQEHKPEPTPPPVTSQLTSPPPRKPSKDPSGNDANAYATIFLQDQPLAAAGCAAYFMTDPSTGHEVHRLERVMDKTVWRFQPKALGSIDSTPLIVGDRVYIAAAHRTSLDSYGRLYCLKRATGEQVWKFDNEGDFKQVFSTPCLVGDRLFLGEGYHQDSFCRLFCLNAKDGKKVWEFKTKSHTESSPCVVDGKVYFGAGDDGVYCVSAADGKEVWHWPGLHVDTNPTVVNGRLYGGSAYGDKYWMYCLNAATGKPEWRTESRLPVFGSPTVYGKRVFFGTGNGDMLTDAKKPAGAVLCLDAASGAVVWRFDQVKNSVLTQPAVDFKHVYVGSRDGNVYCIGRRDGKLRWNVDLHSPVVSSPALAVNADWGETEAVYALGTAGRLCALEPETGELLAAPYEAFGAVQGPVTAVSSVRVAEEGDGSRRVYFGVGYTDGKSSKASLYCVEDRAKK